MAITTLDGVGAGALAPREFQKALSPTPVTGRAHSTFYTAGVPGAAAAPSPGLAGAALTSYDGALPFTNPSSGNSYLSRVSAQSTIGGVFLLCDRLWHNSGIDVTSTGAQTINSVAFPARDAAGSTSGDAILVGVEVSTVTGAGTPTLTMGYTNQSGTASRTSANILATAATAPAGTFYFLGLQAGDTGVRSIQTMTLSATWTSGAIHLVAYRVLSRLEQTQDGVGVSLDWITGGGCRLYDNTVPFIIFIPRTTSTYTMSGHIIVTQG